MLRGNTDWILQFFFLTVLHPQALSITFNTTFRLTETARQRMEHMRKNLDQTKENDLKKAFEERKMQKKLLSLKKTVARKAMAHDPSRNRQSEDREKMRNFR